MQPAAWVLCLFVFLMIVVFAGIELAVHPHVRSDISGGAAMALLSCLSGLVVTEQLLRDRDVRRLRQARRAAAAAEEGVPARP